MKKFSLLSVAVGFFFAHQVSASPPTPPVEAEFLEVPDIGLDGNAIDPALSELRIHPTTSGVLGAEVKRTLYQEGTVFEISFGETVAWTKDKDAPTDRTVSADVPEDLSDGYYSEIVDITVLEKGADLPQTVRLYRYFRVEKGRIGLITCGEYSEATTVFDVLPNSKGKLERVARGTDAVSASFAAEVARCEKNPKSCQAIVEVAGD
ncbi:MAG: hypothetical protein PHU25_05630 [Deltaproteobacteria bacterium]|nr:hypothetical protein [Deltaproteobacteria bacterium]